MKKAMLVGLFLAILMSCSMPMDYANFDNLLKDVPYFSTMEEAWSWVDYNIHYKYDPIVGLWDAWQTPEETLEKRTGDCEDFSILLMYFIYALGEDSSLILCTYDGNPHVIIKYKGQYLEPQVYGKYYTENDSAIKIVGVLASSYEAALYVSTVKSISEPVVQE